jgi:hypothetical protein
LSAHLFTPSRPITHCREVPLSKSIVVPNPPVIPMLLPFSVSISRPTRQSSGASRKAARPLTSSVGRHQNPPI